MKGHYNTSQAFPKEAKIIVWKSRARLRSLSLPLSSSFAIILTQPCQQVPVMSAEQWTAKSWLSVLANWNPEHTGFPSHWDSLHKLGRLPWCKYATPHGQYWRGAMWWQVKHVRPCYIPSCVYCLRPDCSLGKDIAAMLHHCWKNCTG